MVNVRTVACILDLLVEGDLLVRGPAAATEYTLRSWTTIHAYITAAWLRPLLFKLVSNLGAVAHRKVVNHVTRVNIVPFLHHSLFLLTKNALLPQVRLNHETVTLLSECHNRLPNVNLGDLRVQHNFPDDRPDVLEVLWGRGRSPFQCLCHVISGPKWQSNENNFPDVNQGLEDLNRSHNSPITSHQRHYNLGSSMETMHCLLNHFIAALAFIVVQNVEDMGVGTQAKLLKLALDVSLFVEELRGFLVAWAGIGREENVVRVSHLSWVNWVIWVTWRYGQYLR